MPRTRPLERPLAQALGLRLQNLRHDAALTQEQVALRAGISRNHYQLLEQGLSDRKKDTPSNPTLTTLIDVARALGSSIPDLLGDIVYPRPGEATIEYAAGPHAAPRQGEATD